MGDHEDSPPPIPAHQPGLGRRHGQGQGNEREDRADASERAGERGSTEIKLVPEVVQKPRKKKKRRSSTCKIALGVFIAGFLWLIWLLVSYQTIAVRPCIHPDAKFQDRPPPTMVPAQVRHRTAPSVSPRPRIPGLRRLSGLADIVLAHILGGQGDRESFALRGSPRSGAAPLPISYPLLLRIRL